MATTVWRGHISFGLVSIPVRLFRAARRERVKLRELYRVEPAPEEMSRPAGTMRVADDISDADDVRSGLPRAVRAGDSEVLPSRPALSKTTLRERAPEVVAPVRHASFSQDTDEIVASRALTKGFEIEKDRFITLDREELRSLDAKTAAEMEILEFVHLAEIDPVYFEASYYLRPEEAGQQPYALLYEAMRQTGLVALARFAMHRREHVIILRPGRSGIIGHTMYFAAEVGADQEYTADPTLVNAKNLELAKMLTETLATKFEPGKYRDAYRERLEALIAAKMGGEQAAAIAGAQSTVQHVVDITEALRKSLQAVKKPPVSVPAPQKKSAKHRRHG